MHRVISGGLAGAYFRKRWEELTEKPHLVAKGKMAIRNLKLLLSNINFYESRLKCYIERLKNKDQNNIRFIEYLEEIIDWCKSLQEVCLTSIENWEDIIPEAANVISQIGTFSELRIVENNLKTQIDILTTQLKESEEEKGKTAEDKEKLSEELKTRETELRQITKQVQEFRKEIRSGILGGLTANVATLGTSGSYVSPMDNYGALPLEQRAMSKICKLCNKPYYTSGILSFIDDNICGECKKQGKGISLIGGS
jgi:flagellar biosynthesis chaperone FliJ